MAFPILPFVLFWEGELLTGTLHRREYGVESSLFFPQVPLRVAFASLAGTSQIGHQDVESAGCVSVRIWLEAARI